MKTCLNSVFKCVDSNAFQKMWCRQSESPLQYLLLLHLKGFSGREWANIGELAIRLQAKPHGVVALVTRCEVLGLVERVQRQDDRRQIDVYLLPKGEQILQQLAELHRGELTSLHGVFAVPGFSSEV